MTNKPTKEDLETQLHKALGDLIKTKEQRNTLKEYNGLLREQLKSSQFLAGQAGHEINILRLRATAIHEKSFFGNWFAKDIKSNWRLEDLQGQLEAFSNKGIK